MEFTAVEVAAGRGNPDHPLLHPVYSPMSRVPCTDFSPWLRERLAAGDRDSAAIYVLGVIEANPGIGIELPGDITQLATSGLVPNTSKLWATTWLTAVRAALDASLDDLKLADEAALDLHTALVTHLPLFGFGLHWLRKGAATLAALMAVHDVHLRDPQTFAAKVNAAIARERAIPFGLIVDDLADVSPQELIPGPTPSPAPVELRAMSHATRCHVMNIAERKASRFPAMAHRFGTYYPTRQIGCDEDESLTTIINAGLVHEVSDPDVIWQTKASTLTVKELRALLDGAGIHAPKSALKARLLNLARPIADDVLAVAEAGPVLELTTRGREVTNWLRERVTATDPMWAAWAAIRFPV